MIWDLNRTCQAQGRSKIISRACPGCMNVSEMSSQTSLLTAKPTINPRATRWTHNKPKLRDGERAPLTVCLISGESLVKKEFKVTVSESRPRREQRNSSVCPAGHCLVTRGGKLAKNMVTRPCLL